MPANVRVSGSYKSVSKISVRVAGAWKEVSKGFTRVGGAWKEFFSSAPASAFVLLESTTLTSSQASVSFTNLTTKYAATYKHLQIRAVNRNTDASNTHGVLIRFNGDSGSNYAQHVLFGGGSSVSSAAGTSQTFGVIGLSSRSGDSSFGVHVTDILDPFNSSKNTTTRSLLGTMAVETFVQLRSNAWFNTASVTSIEVIQNAASFTSGTRISLYGIRGS